MFWMLNLFIAETAEGSRAEPIPKWLPFRTFLGNRRNDMSMEKLCSFKNRFREAWIVCEDANNSVWGPAAFYGPFCWANWNLCNEFDMRIGGKPQICYDLALNPSFVSTANIPKSPQRNNQLRKQSNFWHLKVQLICTVICQFYSHA